MPSERKILDVADAVFQPSLTRTRTRARLANGTSAAGIVARVAVTSPVSARQWRPPSSERSTCAVGFAPPSASAAVQATCTERRPPTRAPARGARTLTVGACALRDVVAITLPSWRSSMLAPFAAGTSAAMSVLRFPGCPSMWLVAPVTPVVETTLPAGSLTTSCSGASASEAVAFDPAAGAMVSNDAVPSGRTRAITASSEVAARSVWARGSAKRPSDDLPVLLVVGTSGSESPNRSQLCADTQ